MEEQTVIIIEDDEMTEHPPQELPNWLLAEWDASYAEEEPTYWLESYETPCEVFGVRW